MVSEDLKKEFNRRVFEESYQRIYSCLDILSGEQIWHKVNSQSNSIANLILHLLGNMEQWICSTFASLPDTRKRSLEFELSEGYTKEDLKAKMENLKSIVEEIISGLSEKDLLKEYKVQVYEENGTSILVHVIEHFSYHTGQIATLTKLFSDKDLEFYPYSLE